MINAIGTNVAGPKDEETQAILDRHLLNHIHLLKEKKNLGSNFTRINECEIKQLLSIR
jgi:hypothetical protein